MFQLVPYMVVMTINLIFDILNTKYLRFHGSLQMKKTKNNRHIDIRVKMIFDFMRNNLWVCMLFMAMLSLITLFFLQELGKIPGEDFWGEDAISILILVMSSLIAFIATFVEFINYYKESKEKRYFRYREYLVRELANENERNTSNTSEKSKNKSDENTSLDKKDIFALMLKNHDEINEYFKISKWQAKIAFWLSVIACICGLGTLIFGVYSVFILNNINVSIISIVSGSISEVIAATVFWVHNKSALQLNHYYNALHENEKFLSAVNMADKLNEENRERMIMEIIRNQIVIQNKKDN